nr:ATP-binding cassette domain-containing protein [Alteromonas sp. a30]
MIPEKSKTKQQGVVDPRQQGKYFHSLQDVSFQCEHGQVLGLLGPNGAGKTTTLRILSTALCCDEGRIFIDNEELTQQPETLRKKIGFLSGTTGLYGRLTGRENIEYFGRLHGMSKASIKQRVDSLAQELDMQTYLDRRCESYSTGMKQKVAIARAVVHEPQVVILDEPTTGLDIMATQTVLNFIQRLKQNSVSVIFSTHHLDEVQTLCDQVCVINQGKVCFLGDLAQFSALSDISLHDAFTQTLAGEH